MAEYQYQTRILVAVDCILFGFDGEQIQLLLIKRGFEPMKHQWSLMGGFVQPDESTDDAANRILKQLTGLEGIYLEQLHTFSSPDRDPIERTVSIAYFALIDIKQYQQQLTDQFQAAWFPMQDIPTLIFDHEQMVKMARQRLRYKAASHPVLFELLPQKFTLPVLQHLFEDVYDTQFDKGNFSRKMLSTGLLLKQTDKDKGSSKKGAFYYKLDKKNYKKNFHQLLRIVPNAHELI
ncbi:NUDIX hydrolase [Phnomibacter sp. MR]|uniref:NUDIX hydrolase n=1 Tax=Phnomibacter sp. MR TaxID=3042318 RepID=UPI003A80140C